MPLEEELIMGHPAELFADSLIKAADAQKRRARKREGPGLAEIRRPPLARTYEVAHPPGDDRVPRIVSLHKGLERARPKFSAGVEEQDVIAPSGAKPVSTYPSGKDRDKEIFERLHPANPDQENAPQTISIRCVACKGPCFAEPWAT